ncbi:unnamed protein product [Spirodela intermedia]|uniref:Reverse transcriptase Ty1/copia-type domain-containing protein n=1 Tax=Spirodela intermedia TaxID=51605 RepID=A0A7I8LFW6_SPIIN|nr:unnamed protein product [Spirodela intermedia]
MDYRQSNGDHTLFFKHFRNEISILLVYVDDMILTGDDLLKIEMLNDKLSACFKIKRLENLKYFLGIEIADSRCGIFLSQLKYILNLLKQTETSGNKLATTPIDPDGKLVQGEDSPPVDRGRYQRLIGKLIYLSHTRPNITYTIRLSQFIHDPREVHNAAARRVLLYLKGTPSYNLLFRPHGHTNVEIFIDVDYAGSIVDKRSTSRYCSFLGGNLITWHNKKQLVVSRSSA